MTQQRKSTSRKTITRRILFSLALLLVLALSASLTFHVYGRYQFASAVAEYEARVGEKPIFDSSYLKPATVPETENIVTWLMAGTQAVVLTREETNSLRQAHYRPRREWTPEVEDEMRTLVERNRPALDLLHRTAELELSNFDVHYGDPSRFEVPAVYPVTIATFLLNAEARLALAEGDVAKGMLVARSLSKITGALYNEPIFILPLIGIVVGRRWIDVTHEVLVSTEPWATDPALLEELEEMMPADPLPRIRQLAHLQGPSVVEDIRYDVEFESRRVPGFLWGRLAGAQALELSWQAGSLMDLPYAETRNHEYRKGPGPRIMWSLRKSLASGIGKNQMFSSQLQLTRAALALRRLGLETGGYPTEPPAIPALTKPEAFGGERIVYERQADGSLRLTAAAALKLVPDFFNDKADIVDDFHRIVLP